MFPAKPLVCGVAAVGSVSTAAVVAHQYGFFSTTNQSQETSDTSVADTSTVPVAPSAPVKTKKDEIKEWLEADEETKTWTIKIKKSEQETEDFKNASIEETDLQGLIDYLKPNTLLLKSFVSSLNEKSLTFEKATSGWKLILATTDIENWINKISQNTATLKLATKEGNTRELSKVQDLNKLLKDLFDGKSVFENIKLTKPETKKNILFKKEVDDVWKHYKSGIESWLKTEVEESSKFEIKVKKGSDAEKTLDEADEENLIGLLKYLKEEENKKTLLNLIKDKTPTSLTFKKEGTNWELIHNKTTIDNWVSNVAGSQTTLELYEENVKKAPGESEWKTLFDAISKETELFKKSEETRTIIFEIDGTNWKHIKKAIKEWLQGQSFVSSKIKIKKADSETPVEISEVKDNGLIGLLKYLKSQSTTYTSTLQADKPDVVLKKKDGDSNNEWEQVTTTPVAA